MLYALIAIAGITSFLAYRSYFPLLKFGAGVFWLALLAYLVMNYSGENWVVIAYLGCVVMMCAIPLSGLGRDIKRSQDISSGLMTDSQSTTGFHFKIPDWLKAGGREETTRRKRESDLEDYRAKIHRALNPPRKKR